MCEGRCRGEMEGKRHTATISFPLARRKALVYLALKGLCLLLKCLLHLDLQNRKTCICIRKTTDTFETNIMQYNIHT